MKKFIISVASGIFLFSGMSLKAQLKVGSDGMYIQGGTVFYSEGLTLVPAKDWGLNNTSILKDAAVVIWPKFNSVQRIHRFSRPVTFQGELAMNYLDIELNGNEAKNLVLAHTKTNSNNFKDFELIKESVINTNERYVGQLFSKPIDLSDITAVSMESSAAAPYSEIIANNMITPNGDGVNDVWIVKNIHLYPNNEVRIFDREGRVVFKKNGYDNTWDGQYNGNPLPEDTYYYILSFDSDKGRKTGFVSIVRDK